MDTFSFRINGTLLQAARDTATAQHTTITQLLIDGLVAELARRGRNGAAVRAGGSAGGSAGSSTAYLVPPRAEYSAVDTWPVIHVELPIDEYERVMHEIQAAAEYQLQIRPTPSP